MNNGIYAHAEQQAMVAAGQLDVKAVVDQEISQEIARLEAKIDAVISKSILQYEGHTQI